MSKMSLMLAFIALSTLATPLYASDDDEVTLFNASGAPEAYIALNDEMNIYLWSGAPIAYLSKDDDGGYHVYGFNGDHLGWFVNGVVWDHQGNAACAVKEVLRTTQYEPYKSYKEYAPYKSYREYAPYRPSFTRDFGSTTCRFLLAEGKG